MSGDWTILGLDLGSTMGWAFAKNATILNSGTVPLTRKDAHPGDRFVRFNNWLQDWRNVKEICYEDVPRFESAAAAKSYCGYLSVLQMFCLVHGIRLAAAKPSSVKLGFAGKGNANKFDMCKVAHKLGWKHGHVSTDLDHDECDAIATVWVILARRGSQPELA